MNRFNSGLFVDSERLLAYAAEEAKLLPPLGNISARAEAEKLEKEYRLIRKTHELVSRRYADTMSPPAACEWLLDNFYLVRKEYVGARSALRSAIRLRSCRQGALVCALSRTLLCSGRGSLSEERIELFLRGFQSVTPLTLSELELIPAALRCAVIEEIGAVCESMQYAADTASHADALSALFSALRLLGNIDMQELLLELNICSRIFLQDYTGEFARMDSETKREYLEKNARLAEKQGIAEHTLAKRLIKQSRREKRHVGFYLFEAVPEMRGKLYIAANLLLSPLLSIAAGLALESVAAALLLLVPVATLVKALLDFVLMHLSRPGRVPRMEVSEGIPDEGRTICVISTLLGVAEPERLEQLRLLSVREGRNLCFGLLADYPTAKTKTMPEDKNLLHETEKVIDALNRRYGGGFFLFTRERSFNGEEFCGHERKRGAVMALAALLCDRENELQVFGNRDALNEIKYIITLDSDTQVYPGALGELIGAALHPLCRPVIDRQTGCVRAGHAILHPRLSVELMSANATDFALIYAGAGGSDPYAGVGAELYMDLFDNGGFSGKGIIDAEALTECMHDRLPEGCVLSHDALEGAYLRGAYVGDAGFSDSFPTKPLSYFKRAHRWIRGDWQNLPWIWARELGALDRFRLFDSIRRSLVAPLTFAAIMVGFFARSAGIRLAAAAALLALLTELLLCLAQRGMSRRAPFHLRRYTRLLTGTGGAIVRCFISLWLLPYEAWVNASAALCAVWRMLVSKKHLLQWQTAAQSERGMSDLAEHIKAMWFPIVTGMTLMALSPEIIGKTAGFMWLVSPIAAYALSLSAEKPEALSRSDREFILGAAEAGWRYLEQMSTPEDNYLPPDNFQEQPPVGKAHRTSPTNIALACAAAVAAAEMGIIKRQSAAEYISRIVTTLEGMQRELGHYLNWYDTRSLRPLKPAYISTVDSGNMYAGLLAAANALRAWGRQKLAVRIDAILRDMDFSPLYDRERGLFYICYDTVNRRGVGGWYDLMASEARLTSYLAAAKGDVPIKHWRSLSRAQLQKDGFQGLASWSGTMFEYLMPELFLPLFRGSLLYESSRFCLYAQKRRAYAGKPWGISESAFYALDANLSYRYKAHGCPALALKRGQERDMVISPYSSFLALAVDAQGSVKNLRRLKQLGAFGRFGFIEAVDYTPSRCRGTEGERIVCYMAHHVGMSIIAAANAVCAGVMQRYFMVSPAMRAFTLLLQEKLPGEALVIRRDSSAAPERPISRGGERWTRRGGEEDTGIQCCLLSNGVYSLMASNRGSASADYGAICVYRGDEERSGAMLRLNGERVLPCRCPESWELGEEQVRTACRIGDISLRAAISVSGECCGELRCYELSSRRGGEQELELSLLPILAEYKNYVNHTAYWQLGLEGSVTDGKLLIRRLSKGETGELWLCIACSREAKFSFSETDGEYVSAPRAAARLKLRLLPEKTESISFSICVSFDRAEALAAADRILAAGQLSAGNMVGAAAAHLGMSTEEIGRAMELTARLRRNALHEAAPKSALWQYGISGDLPLICCEGRAAEAPKLLKAFCLLRSCGLEAELVYLSAEQGEYVQPLMQSISKTLDALGLDALIGSRGGVFIVPRDAGEIIKSRSCVVTGEQTESPKALEAQCLGLPRRRGTVPQHAWSDSGFIYYVNQELPPRCWQHILTNGRFGYTATDCGCGFMWYENARELCINPPPESVRAVQGSEEIYLDIGGEKISIFAANDGCPCTVEYGAGYARWRKKTGRRTIETVCFVPQGTDARVLIISGAEGLSLHWRLQAALSAQDGSAVRCSEDGGMAAAENPESFIPGVRFLMAATGQAKIEHGFYPAALRLSTICDRECVLVCGCCEREQIERLREPSAAAALLEKTRERSEEGAGAFRLSCGIEALDRYMSLWCAYQCIVCRLQARTSLYQSGGAIGFRDQLQDSINMLLIRQDYARAQILECCAHQYVEGDVMHWWHRNPSGDRGVRTRCADDMLWLCWALCEYCRATGDYGICEEQARYIDSPRLGEHERDRYETAVPSQASASAAEHAKAALDCCITRGFGTHGLPWFGSGDWNDALDRVDGESVWLGWFFAECALDYAELMDKLGLPGSARYRQYAERVGAAADSAFNGSWYLRGIYADAGHLGGAERIDSVSQSWAAMSRFADLDKVKTALNMALCRLVDRENRIVKLFDPPYSADERSPGYITGYGRGVRENGGQYTHGAIWLAIAALRQGRTDEGCEILRMLLPDGHDLSRYEAEPFVLAADVTSADGIEGRAGWTWYTGSAGWYFRAVTQEVLGLRLRGGRLYIEPRLPSWMPSYRVIWRDRSGRERLIECAGGEIFVDKLPYSGQGID